MPMMISLRKFMLSSKNGHMIAFKPSEPVHVPDEVVSEAMGAGCVLADPEQQVFFDESKKARVDFSGALRTSLLTRAITDLSKRNNPQDFTGANFPKLSAVKGILGFEVFKEEVADAFRSVMGARASGEPPLLHADTDTVYDIIQAEDKSDLQKYVGEDEAARGLTTKDLRKHLLMRYSGLAPG